MLYQCKAVLSTKRLKWAASTCANWPIMQPLALSSEHSFKYVPTAFASSLISKYFWILVLRETIYINIKDCKRNSFKILPNLIYVLYNIEIFGNLLQLINFGQWISHIVQNLIVFEKKLRYVFSERFNVFRIGMHRIDGWLASGDDRFYWWIFFATVIDG